MTCICMRMYDICMYGVLFDLPEFKAIPASSILHFLPPQIQQITLSHMGLYHFGNSRKSANLNLKIHGIYWFTTTFSCLVECLTGVRASARKVRLQCWSTGSTVKAQAIHMARSTQWPNTRAINHKFKCYNQSKKVMK